ncbi:MAG: hypothetical protein H7Y04_11330 [Verrucomicrobia bacterium]|nr:hypothetical protein [Cytophagales bacterium]
MTLLKKSTLFACLFLPTALFSQSLFPELTGKTLQDKTLTIPNDTKGKFTILCLTYSQKSSDVLQNWLQPIYETFLTDPDYDVHMYFVPMLSGIKELAAGTIEKKMKQGFDPQLHPYILLYKGEIGDYKKTLNMTEKDIPYFFVLNKEGKIVHQVSGNYTDAKMEKMSEIVE